VIFVDSNVPMYLIGAEHPHKHDARAHLERLAASRNRLVTSADVFQEILHRFVALDRRNAVQAAFDRLGAIVDDVFPIEIIDVMEAKDVAATHPDLSARDSLHVAVMRHHGISQVLSFDRGFDQVNGIARLPAR
jgi:predicted nucleic acid-binding protein